MIATPSSLGNRIFKCYIFPSKLPVDTRKGFQLVLRVVPLLGVQENLTKEHHISIIGWLMVT
jgi:hypothetical protein